MAEPSPAAKAYIQSIQEKLQQKLCPFCGKRATVKLVPRIIIHKPTGERYRNVVTRVTCKSCKRKAVYPFSPKSTIRTSSFD
jgi:hypothetical protein